MIIDDDDDNVRHTHKKNMNMYGVEQVVNFYLFFFF